MLTSLQVHVPPGLHMPASDLAVLASLVALQHLRIYGDFDGPAFPRFLGSMAQLTELRLNLTDQLRLKFGPPHELALGACTRLCSLWLRQCCPPPGWPAEPSSMTQLTELHITACGWTELPRQLTALPALEVLDLSNNRLTGLPQLACLSSLRELSLEYNNLSEVPAVLGGGSASRLEKLLLVCNGVKYGHLGNAGVALLESLTALQTLSLSGVSIYYQRTLRGVGEHLRQAMLAGWSRVRFGKGFYYGG